MKHLISFLLSISLLLPFNTYGFENEPNGFRGIEWKTDFATVEKEMTFLTIDDSYGGIKKYNRVGDELKIGGAKILPPIYSFWKNKFCSAWIYVEGKSNWLELKDAVFEKFGEGSKPNQYIEKYFWHGTKTSMMFQYNEIPQKGLLYLRSEELQQEMSNFQKEKAREGAKKGF